MPDQLTGEVETWPWDELLDFSNAVDENDRKQWNHRTLPLLARPELGFPPTLQVKFLAGLSDAPPSVIRGLLEERKRLITDAIIAARLNRDNYDFTIPHADEVTTLIARIDEVYEGSFEEPNYWSKNVKLPSGGSPDSDKAGEVTNDETR